MITCLKVRLQHSLPASQTPPCYWIRGVSFSPCVPFHRPQAVQNRAAVYRPHREGARQSVQEGSFHPFISYINFRGGIPSLYRIAPIRTKSLGRSPLKRKGLHTDIKTPDATTPHTAPQVSSAASKSRRWSMNPGRLDQNPCSQTRT